VYNLDKKDELDIFVTGSKNEIEIYGSSKKIKYDPEPKIGIGVSKIGTSEAISLGAYAYALNNIS
jgi:glucokinase